MFRLWFAPRRFAEALYSLALTVSLTISISLHAEVAGTGTIQGTVTDPTGAFLPGATSPSPKKPHTSSTRPKRTRRCLRLPQYRHRHVHLDRRRHRLPDPLQVHNVLEVDPTSTSTPVSPSVKQSRPSPSKQKVSPSKPRTRNSNRLSMSAIAGFRSTPLRARSPA